MKWSDYAVDSLKKHLSRQMALLNLSDCIKELDERFKSCGCTSNTTPVMGGQSQVEDKLLNNIAERDELKENYRCVKRSVNRVNRALSVLDERQRKVLDRFYISRTGDHVDSLCEELHIEAAQVYRIKDEALKKFTLALYGVIDI